MLNPCHAQTSLLNRIFNPGASFQFFVRRSCLAMLTAGGILTGNLMADDHDYPKTRKDSTGDTLHGQKVDDPYRWLEDDVRKSAEVKQWVEEENKVTFGYLEKLPARKKIQQRLTKLWNYEKVSAPSRLGGKYWFFRNNGLQNQSVLFARDTLTADPRVILDPNTWSKDGTVALSGWSPTDDGKLLAYGAAEAGSDWVTWRVLDLATLKPLADEIRWVKFNSPAWRKDGSGFYYGRFDEPKADQKFQALNLNMKVFFHKLGTPQAEDKQVHATPDHPDWGFQTLVTDDGNYMVVITHVGTDHRYRVEWADLRQPELKLVPLVDKFENEWDIAGNSGSTFYFKTNLGAPLGRVVKVDLAKSGDCSKGPITWDGVVPQATEKLDACNLVGGKVICSYLKDAYTQVRLFNLDGKEPVDLKLPGIGTAGGFSGKLEETETFYSFSSFATPGRIYRLDLKTLASELTHQSKVDFDPDLYVTRQVFFSSKDGTKVPMFLCHKKGLKPDGTNPTLLYAYGGFSISLTPGFSVGRLAWMEMGGVLAVANLRGGGEYGEDWHKAGTKERKQNVFDDFIGAAEYLIAQKITSPGHLGIQGGSNGGLLVGAVMTQRPELFGACLPAVGVMDMLRFQKFTAGRYWVDDYGSSDNAPDFKYLLAYSPYHNLKAGTRYPPTLVTTGDTDDRVVPGHSFKFAARLQECQAGKAPVLIRIETRAGHGAGKPTSMVIEEVADQWAFLAANLGMKTP